MKRSAERETGRREKEAGNPEVSTSRGTLLIPDFSGSEMVIKIEITSDPFPRSSGLMRTFGSRKQMRLFNDSRRPLRGTRLVPKRCRRRCPPRVLQRKNARIDR